MNHNDINNTYDEACLFIVKQAIGGEITAQEAEYRIAQAARKAHAARHGVPIAELSTPDLRTICRRLGIEL